jgi:arsenate reductase
MAEAFAGCYGADVIEPLSAGWAPASIVQPLTIKVMEEKNIHIEDFVPRDLSKIDVRSIDIIVNMSGRPLPGLPVEIREWKVEDPIGQQEEVYREVRDKLEHLVMGLILELRRTARPVKRGPSLRSRLRAEAEPQT